MSDWRIYYGDGSTFSSADGEPQESPAWGAVLVTQPAVKGMDTLLLNDPFFVHRADRALWLTCDYPGLMDQLAHYAHAIDCVRVGRWAEPGDWKAIAARAREEVDECRPR